MGHISFGPRNVDAATPDNLTLDALSSADIARYRSGEWLEPRVPSSKLRRSEDPEGVDELAARAQVWLEHRGAR